MVNWLSDVIGNTPLVELEDNLFAKLEFMNFTGSIKDRSCLEMLNKLDKKIRTIIEPTSGNLGISLASIGRILGFDIIICMPKIASVERVKMIEALGGKVILVDGGMKECLYYALKLKMEIPNSCILNQFSNINNVLAHYKTGMEIYEQLNDIDYFVCGIGTGGTISGAGSFLIEKTKCKVIGVMPNSINHRIEGIGANFKPDILNEDIIEKVVTISDEDAIKGMRILLSKYGIMAGISSGACYMAGLAIKKFDNNGKVVIILPDSYSRYLSLDLL